MFLKLGSLIGMLVCLNGEIAFAILGDATYYNLGLTACGTEHGDGEMVAAVGVPHWGEGNPNLDPICGRSVSVRDPQSGRSVVVIIRDKCMSCNYNNIDLSPAAFKLLKPLDVGRFQVDWNFV